MGWHDYRLICMYGEPDRSGRKMTWELVRILSLNSTLPWCLIGDLNNVLS